ncbi:MAG: 6-carboxytetrahydropterin synthase [Chthoniobacterales bacterium]
MLLTVSKRLEFSASRRLFDPKLSESENRAQFGDESAARYGTGRNYVAYFVFSGAVDPETGMLINISEIKRRAGQIIDRGFDHKFLNEDNPAFAEVVPTAENIARQLFAEVEPLFRETNSKLVACHLRETETRSATAYASGACDANYWFEFSAARQTMSPRLSAQENDDFFGSASSPFGHGHHYRARLTWPADATSGAPIRELIHSLVQELDHKNLNHEVAALEGRAITTESLAAYIFERGAKVVPLQRIRLHERDDFFAEHWSDGRNFLGMRRAFSAAHRLHVRTLSPEQNAELFGKCNNPRGHGHWYLTEATIGGALDSRSGTLYDFTDFQNALRDAVSDWDNRHLDLETEEFRERPSTGENIVQALWEKLNPRLTNRLERLRLWETTNNRFTLRR